MMIEKRVVWECGEEFGVATNKVWQEVNREMMVVKRAG